MFNTCLCWALSGLGISLYGKRQKLYLSGSYRLAFIVNQKLKYRTYKLRKGDDRISVLQLAIFRSKKPIENEIEIWIKKDSCKLRIRLKIVEHWLLGNYKVNCHQLLNMLHAQNYLDKIQKAKFLQKARTLDLKM